MIKLEKLEFELADLLASGEGMDSLLLWEIPGGGLGLC